MPKLKKLKSNREKEIEQATKALDEAVKFLELDEKVQKILLDKYISLYVPSNEKIRERIEFEVDKVIGSKFIFTLVMQNFMKDCLKEVIGELSYDLKEKVEEAIKKRIIEQIQDESFLEDY